MACYARLPSGNIHLISINPHDAVVGGSEFKSCVRAFCFNFVVLYISHHLAKMPLLCKMRCPNNYRFQWNLKKNWIIIYATLCAPISIWRFLRVRTDVLIFRFLQLMRMERNVDLEVFMQLCLIGPHTYKECIESLLL